MSYKSLSLFELFFIFKKRFLLILTAMVLCGISAFLVSKYLMIPQYTSSASLYVYSNANRSQNQITSSELTASQELVNTYIVVLKSDTVLDQVIKKLNLMMTADDIRAVLKTGSIDGTEAFKISVTDPDPQTAQLIVNTIVDIAPREIIRVVQAGGAEIIDHAKMPSKPSSPNVMLITVLGVFLGLILSFGIFVVLVVFDTRIRNEDDLKNTFTIPVLGCVPELAER